MAETKFLIIDDDTGICETLSDILHEKGYSVATAGTGREAIDKAKQTTFDVALIDIKLPDMDGTALLSKLKKSYPGMACIIITGNTIFEKAIRALESGANGYFVKPLVIENVVHRAEEVVDKQRLQRELRESERKYRTLVDNSLVGAYKTNLKGDILYVNEAFARMLEFESSEDMISDGIISIYKNPKHREIFIKNFKKKGKVNNYEIEVVTRTGKFKNILVSATIEGNVISGMVTDITERKLAEEELKKSFEKLQRILDETVNALASTTEKRDPYTAGHQQRVTNLACAIAKEMTLPEKQIKGIRVAGILHDIGKVYIPAEILNKPGQLNEMEMGLIKLHPQVGYDILKPIEFPWPVAQIVLQHHERMNGSGYLAGLSDGEIFLEARILGLADIVEAMSSHRPYRAARGIDKALKEISRNRGVLYDPNVVDACMKLLTEKGFRF